MNEIQNHHENGWRTDFYSDSSIDGVIAKLDALKGDGISGTDMDDLITGSDDYGQLTEREYSAMKQWVGGNWHLLSPEAKEKWLKFDSAVSAAGGRGTAVHHHHEHEEVILDSAQLSALYKDVLATAKSAPPAIAASPDGVDRVATREEPPTATPVASSSSPPPAGGAGKTPNDGKIKLSDHQTRILEAADIKIDNLSDADKNMFNAQQAMQEYSRMVQFLTNLLQLTHEAQKAVIQNIRP